MRNKSFVIETDHLNWSQYGKNTEFLKCFRSTHCFFNEIDTPLHLQSASILLRKNKKKEGK
jgi:hypothetical protein